MPTLDVSEVLDDPDLSDTFNVIRRADTVGSDGRSVTTPTVYNNVVGVVCMASPNDLDRQDVGEITGAMISVVTSFRLRGSGEGFQPDQIVWDGGTYTVKTIDKYHRYGAGFTSALAMSMNASTPPAV